MDDLDLDRALRAVLSVDPSPEFVARVRTTIAKSPRPSIAMGWLTPTAAVACAAVVAIVIGLPRQDGHVRQDAQLKLSPTDIVLSPTDIALSPTDVALRPAESAPAPTEPSVVVPTLPNEPPLPEVIVAAGDVEALLQLLVSLNEHRFVASFDETPASTPWVMTDLSVAPIAGGALDPTPAHNN